MRENITKVAERGERLDALQDKTGQSAVAMSQSITDIMVQTTSLNRLRVSARAQTVSASRWCVIDFAELSICSLTSLHPLHLAVVEGYENAHLDWSRYRRAGDNYRR